MLKNRIRELGELRGLSKVSPNTDSMQNGSSMMEALRPLTVPVNHRILPGPLWTLTLSSNF